MQSHRPERQTNAPSLSKNNQQEQVHEELIGLVPSAGMATRIAPLPCSKELYPVGFQHIDSRGNVRPKVACHYLLERMHTAGVTKTYIILREGKWDIPAYFRDGKMLDMHLAYLLMDLPYGVPYTLDQAYPFLRDSTVVFGFPDIIFRPKDAFVQLLDRQATTHADVVLGLFPAIQPQKVDMVALDADGRVRDIQIKPVMTDLRHTWLIAVWTSDFTAFLHDFIMAHKLVNYRCNSNPEPQSNQELYVGDVIRNALEKNLKIETVLFPHGKYVDIGTPEGLKQSAKCKF